MKYYPEEKKFKCLINLPREKHEYKYIVDGVWKYSKKQQIKKDNTNNINNFLDLTNFIPEDMKQESKNEIKEVKEVKIKMKENNNNKEILIEEKPSDSEFSFPVNQEDLDMNEEPKKRCCLCNCCFYLFCCCCCHPDIKSNDFYKKNWKNYLYKEGQEASDLPFNKLTRLFANADEEAIEALYVFRLNPNLVSENKLRNDLEFYIPQLCTFLLFGDIKAIEEFFVFLCKVCNASFFFAHRVHWFLSAMINAAQEKKEDIINILKMINTVFKSPEKKSKNKLEKIKMNQVQ